MKKRERKKKISNGDDAPDFKSKRSSSFTLNYLYAESDLNVNRAFDLLFEEVLKEELIKKVIVSHRQLEV